MKKHVKIEYKNHRGEEATRTIFPISVRFGKNEWHSEDQWLLFAYDLDKLSGREFAMKDIKSWTFSK